jgi:hypothetical protein
MAYISNDDVSRDALANQFSSDFTTYHTLVDNHINELAEGEQVDTTDIATDDGTGYLSNKFLRRYAATWFICELFKDKMGINNNSLADEEKYRVKYEIYNKKVEKMEGRVTAEMLQNEINSRMSTSKSHNIYRS